MAMISIQDAVSEVGQVCLSGSAILTLSRVFSVAKPVASLMHKGPVNDGFDWIAGVAVEDCTWPRVVFAKVDLLQYLLLKRPALYMYELLGNSTDEDTYVYTFLQDMQQPFPVYEKLKKHTEPVYSYFAKRWIDKFIVDYPGKVFRAADTCMFVSLDILDLGALQEILRKAPEHSEQRLDESTPVRCELQGDGVVVTVIDSPTASLLREISFGGSPVWLYVDHETAHLAGRVIDLKFV
jgi:hypothetical protein